MQLFRLGAMAYNGVTLKVNEYYCKLATGRPAATKACCVKPIRTSTTSFRGLHFQLAKGKAVYRGIYLSLFLDLF